MELTSLTALATGAELTGLRDNVVMARSGYQWLIRKSGPEPLLHRCKTEYAQHARASRAYSHWISGFCEDEIAAFFKITVEEVKSDLQHVESLLATRTLLAHMADRNRILIQRAEGEHYRQLLHSSLSTPVSEYLASGVSPVGPLREFREAVGMIEKPGAISVNVDKRSLTVNQVRGMEDIVRAILASPPELNLAMPDGETKQLDAIGTSCDSEPAAQEEADRVPQDDRHE